MLQILASNVDSLFTAHLKSGHTICHIAEYNAVHVGIALFLIRDNYTHKRHLNINLNIERMTPNNLGTKLKN